MELAPSWNLEERVVALALRGNVWTIAEILRSVRIDPRFVRTAVQSLEVRGMVEVQHVDLPDPDQSRVRLTPQGDALAERFQSSDLAERDGGDAPDLIKVKQKALGALSHNGRRFVVEALKAANTANEFHARNVGKLVGSTEISRCRWFGDSPLTTWSLRTFTATFRR